jgi:hypothetical protein
VRDVYLADQLEDAELLVDKAIEGCAMDPVDEVASLGRTLARWRTEILAHHTTGASSGPTEGLNLLVKTVKRAGHGSASSPTTGYGSCSMRAASTGPPNGPLRRSSGRARHAETGRASMVGAPALPLRGFDGAHERLSQRKSPEGRLSAPTASL